MGLHLKATKLNMPLIEIACNCSFQLSYNDNHLDKYVITNANTCYEYALFSYTCTYITRNTYLNRCVIILNIFYLFYSIVLLLFNRSIVQMYLGVLIPCVAGTVFD